MNVSLTPELEQMVEEKVHSGQYESTSEVMREALRLLKRRDQLHQMKLEALRSQIDIARGQIDRGEVIPGEEALARLRAERRQAAG